RVLQHPRHLRGAGQAVTEPRSREYTTDLQAVLGVGGARQHRLWRAGLMSRNVLPPLVVLVLTVIGPTTATPVGAATFTVASTADDPDMNPGDGVCATASSECTLRAAIDEANALAGSDIVNLPNGTYSLGSALNVTDSLTINGAGAGSVIDGG